MLKIPIEILIIGICAISLVIVILSMYLVLKGTRDHIVSRKKKKYIQNKQDIWYRYFNDDIPLPSELIPNNNSEIKAVEEIFLAYVENISSPIIKKKNPGVFQSIFEAVLLKPSFTQEMEFKNERSLSDCKF